MTDKKPISVGDLVTVELDAYNVASNTYHVVAKFEGSSVLSHPLAPDCFIVKLDSELNNTFPSMRSPVEQCLLFAKNNREKLGFTMAADLDALAYYFVVKKSFTAKQRHDLANICGKIASVVLGNNISAAVGEIKHNKVLLDEYNHSLYNSVKKVIADPLSLESKVQRYTIFNIAGFVLAQQTSV